MVTGAHTARFEGALLQGRKTTKTRVTTNVWSNHDGRFPGREFAGSELPSTHQALGHKAKPQNDVNLTARGNRSIGFALQEVCSGRTIFPTTPGIPLFPGGQGKGGVRSTPVLGATDLNLARLRCIATPIAWLERVNYPTMMLRIQSSGSIRDLCMREFKAPETKPAFIPLSG